MEAWPALPLGLGSGEVLHPDHLVKHEAPCDGTVHRTDLGNASMMLACFAAASLICRVQGVQHQMGLLQLLAAGHGSQLPYILIGQNSYWPLPDASQTQQPSQVLTEYRAPQHAPSTKSPTLWPIDCPAHLAW